MSGFSTIDLFSGAGGITEGFRQAGFRCVFANDLNAHALATFALNHPNVWTNGQPIEDLDPGSIRRELGFAPGELDCLVGGPPCQGFSINAPGRTIEDTRNSLFTHYLGFVREFRPKTIMFENVPGMLSLEGGLVVRRLLDELQLLGYAVSYRILFAAHYGVPQERWRLIVLGSTTGSAPLHPVPSHLATGRANFAGGKTLTFRVKQGAVGQASFDHLLPQVTVGDALADLPPLEAGEGCELMPYLKEPCSEYSAKLREGSETVRNHVSPKIAAINLERLKHIGPGGSWRDIPHDLLPEGMKKARSSDHTRRYGRLKPDGLSGTVMTKMDPHWGPAFHYSQNRTLTVREAARLQSFPDRYVFTGPRVAQYEQVGNAVPVLMAKAIAASLRTSLTAERGIRELVPSTP